MRPPIILADGLDLRFYDSAATAARAVEAQDVRDDVYVAFDAAGRRLRFTGTSAPDDANAPICLEEEHGSPAEPAVLAALLREHLVATDLVAERHAALSGLVAMAVARTGYSR